jgi:predicted Zn-dependent protease
MRIIRDLIILAAVFGLIWFGFSLWVEPKSQSDIISIEDEEKIGERINEIILQDYEVFRDSSYQILLDSASRRLLNYLDSPVYEYQFTLLSGNEVNAFTAFNGEIFVFKGLIDQCESPEHLAAVLAHEIGHGEQRHVIKNLIRELGLATITVIATGGDPVIVDQIAKVIISSSFTREMEKKADDFAFDLLEKSAVNPQNLAAFFIRLKADKEYYEMPEWLNSHPSLENRIERLVNKKTSETFIENPIEVDMPGK